jgi:exopolysaccharide production protein ExoQ
MVRWYHLASGFFILQCMQATGVVDRIVYGAWAAKAGDKITQSLNLLLIVVSVALFAKGFRQIRNVKTSAMLALGLTGLLLASAVWSIDPQTTVREAIQYFIVVLGAIGLATSLKADEYMDLLARMCLLAAMASLALAIISRGNAFMGGDFVGIFSQKNVLGEAMTMGALASLHGLRVGKGGHLRNFVSLVLIAIVALMSQSATSCLVIFLFCGSDAVVAAIRKGGAVRILAIAGAILTSPLLIYVAAFPDSILESIGKDPTLTGRTEIWAYVIPDIYLKPWLGWGYLAFWSFNNPAAVQISDAVHYVVPQAHNGLLEMLLNVGLVGTSLFVFVLARTVSLSLRCKRTSLATSCLLVCSAVILGGISETVLLAYNEASTSVFFITGMLCERAVRAATLQRYRVALASYPNGSRASSASVVSRIR